MTIKQIENELKAAQVNVLPLLIERHKDDNRKSVTIAVNRAQKRLEKHRSLEEKIKRMAAFDADYGNLVIGLDEAGRGPLAGPVVTAACVIKPCKELLGLDDSKKISEPMRAYLYDIIIQRAIYYDVSIINPSIIDDINILEATKLGMKKNLKNADNIYDVILTDYVFLNDVHRPLHGIVKGDQKSFSIAAASVLAKVTRDRLMVDFDMQYLGYGFAKHKGYGTKQHYNAIEQLGLTPIHRKTFLKDYISNRKKDSK